MLPFVGAALHWTLSRGARDGEDWDEWLEAERERRKWSGDGYESPLCCGTLGFRYGWFDRHCIRGWPPDDVPAWIWIAVTTFLDWRRFGTLPHAGGTLEQDARIMGAFRILSSCMSEIESSARKSAENRQRSGWQRRKR